ncbi:hypothetical protein ACFYN0_19815 [Streptomyces sp. NPDC006704]|uniref:hypothetical protein n=1 Tax=Streptomyces sp. NPDC006704 TaxID=3364760 RepID=UPI0036BA3ACE
MESVGTALHRIWPAQVRTDRLILRPVIREDGSLVSELLTDDRVRAHLGGPVREGRGAAWQAAYTTIARQPGPSSASPTSGRSAR